MGVLLQPGRQQFCDDNGRPLAGGWVYMYQPGTTTPANTWQDAAQTTLNPNPIPLDGGGRATIYGVGNYRQIVQDVFGNEVWDQATGIGMPGVPGGYVYASTYGLRQGGSDATAIQAAVNAAAQMGGATVYLGPGPIAFNAGDQVIWPSAASGVNLRGDGPDTTVITISGNLASDVLVLTAGNLAHCEIRDLGFSCPGAGTGGALIHFANCYSARVENVRMAGGFFNGVQISGGPISGGGNQYLTTIRDLTCPANATANACIIVGDDATGFVQGTYIETCKLAASAYGIYLRNAGGVYVTSTEMLNHQFDGFVTSPAAGEVVKQVELENCNSDSNGRYGYNIGHSGGYAFLITFVNCAGNACVHGMLIGPNPNINCISVVGCQFVINKQNGVNNVGSNAVLITNSLFAGNGVQAGNTYDAILQQGGLNCVIKGNYVGATQGFAAMHRYGVNLTGPSDYTIVEGNTTGGPSGSGSISNTATGTHNIVVNNVGT